MKTQIFIFLMTFYLLMPVKQLIAQDEILSEQKIETIKKMIDEFNNLNIFSGSVLISEKGNVKFINAFGYADRENKIPNTIDTEFDLASVTKLFTVTAIFQLIDNGKLSLFDNIGMYIEGFPNDISEKVTIKHLLTMTSGLDNYMDSEFLQNPTKFALIKERINLIKKQNPKLAFEPGSGIKYSNSGYVLLGGIVENVSKMNYFDYVKKNILSTSGMIHTNFYNFNEGKKRAIGYDRDLSGVYSKSNFKVLPSSDGNGSSTVNDLLLFTLKFCNGNDLISDRSKILYFTTLDTTYKGDFNSLKTNPRSRKFGWLGGLPGISTVIRHSILNDITIIILSNYNNDDVSKHIADRIDEIVATGVYSEVNIPILERIFKTYKEEGIDSVKTKYEGKKFDEYLNTIGYYLLRRNKIEDAIIILKSVVDLYPQSASAYYSLAEAYLIAEKKELAIKNFEKSFELNPYNKRAEDHLKVLKKDKF